MSYPAGNLPYSGVGEAAAGVGGTLWDWTVSAWNALGGVIEDIWPPDDPDTAKALGDAWIAGADALDLAIGAASGAGQRIKDTWPDANGYDMYALIREITKGQYGGGSEGYEELAASMRRIGEFCHQYAEQVARARNQLKSELIHAAVDFALTFAIPGGPWLFATRMALRLAKLVRIASLAGRLGNWTAKAGKIVMIPIKEAADEVVTNGIEQGLNISQGYQDGFNVKESFTNAVAGAVGAPVSAVVGAPGALLGKGIRKTDIGKSALDNPVGKHVSTAVSSFTTNAISSPISSYAAENMVNGNWGALTDVSGYQRSIKDNWLTSGAIGPARANAHLAGTQAHNAVFGQDGPPGPGEVAKSGNPPGGPNPPSVMAPETTSAGAGHGASAAVETGSPQATGTGQEAGSAHPGASSSTETSSAGSASTGAETGSGRGTDALNGNESRGTTDTSVGDRNTGTTSSNHSSSTSAVASTSQSGTSSQPHQTSVSSTSTTPGSTHSGAGQAATGQGASAQAASAQTTAQPGHAQASTATAQPGSAQSGAGQSRSGQHTTTQATPAQPGPANAPGKTPHAKPTEGEPNRSDPGTEPDQDGVTAPIDAPSEPAPDVPVLPAEVPDDQGPPDGPDEGDPAVPAPSREEPALPAAPVFVPAQMPRASGEGNAPPRNESAETPPEHPDDLAPEVEEVWDALPPDVREAVVEAGPAVAGRKLEGLLKSVLAQLIPRDRTTRPLGEQLKALLAEQIRALLANRVSGTPQVTPMAVFTARVVTAVREVAAKKPRPYGRKVAEAELRKFGRLSAKLVEAAEAEGKNAEVPLTTETHLRKILDHLQARGVPGLDKVGESVRTHLKRALSMLNDGDPATREQLRGDQANLTGLEGELRVALTLTELTPEKCAELGLPGLRIIGIGVKTEDTDIDVHGVLEGSGVEVRFEVKHVGANSDTSIVKQIGKHRRDAGPGALIIAVFSNELTSEVDDAIAAGADAVFQWSALGFTVVARRDPGGPSTAAAPNPPGPQGLPPAGHGNQAPGETHAGQEEPEAIRRAMEAETAGAISLRRRFLMGVLIAVRLLGLPNTIDSALEVKPPKSGPVELVRKRVEEEADPADPDKSRRPGPPPDEPDGPPWRGRARFTPGTGEVDVEMSPPAGPPGNPPGRPQGPPVPPSSHAERFYHPDNPARHEHPLPQHTFTRSRLLLSLRSESALRALMAESGLAWNDLRLLLLEHGLLPADARPARVRDVARILEAQWVRSRIAAALQEIADDAAREFAKLAEGLARADSERARKIAEHVRNGTMTPALRGIFVQQIFAEAVAAHEQEILGDHFGRFRLRTSPAYSLDGRGRAPGGPSHYSGWVVPNLTLDLVVGGQPVVVHDYDLNTGSRTPGRDRVHRGNTFARGLFETETLRPADPATTSRARPTPVPAPPGDVPASPNEPGAIERAMEAANAPVLSYGRRVLMGILLAVRLLGVPNTVDSLLELKPPKSGPSDVIRPRDTDERGTRRRRPKGLPPRDPDGRFTTARIDPDTGEITFGDSPGPASMGMSRHDEVGGSRWIDARRTVAPGPWDGAVITGEGVLYAPAGMSIGDDMTTRNAHMRVMIANRPDQARAYVVTLHGSGNGHPIPGLSLTLDSRLTEEQMRAIEEIFMISPEQVAEATLASPYYTPGRPVQLNSCHSGSSGWAQRYADALGAEVIAPMARLDVMPDGSLRVHGFPPGKGWARFTPGGSAPVEVPAPGNLPTAPGPESTGTPSSMDAVINPGRDETAEFLGREDVQDALRRGNEISRRDPDSRIKIDGVPLDIGDAIAKLLPRHPEFVKTLLETPFLLNSLLARPQTLGNVLQYPEAVEIVLESLEELEARGAEEILREHRETPRPGPIETTESQRQAVAGVLAGIPEQYHRVPPGQAGYVPPGKSTPEKLQAYLDGLERSWRSNQDELNELADWLAAEAGGIAKYRDKVKSRVRMVDKLAKDDGSGSVLTDVVGALVRFDTVADVYRALAILHARLASDGSPISIVFLDDRFAGPQKSGYRDIQMSVRLSSGHIAEFRLHLKSIDEVARYEHSLYEVRRDFAAVSREQGRAVTPEETAIEALILRRERELFQEATNRGMTADDEGESS
ncbi:NAD--arginine ADP-ribosyltransferase [Amycolatopsis decaplanina]|uniref:NAD:arginine ADP-ribosyltransferase n=1 Tax=Amycolatopsis decaplanina DSM 44594 TaxID=1284240 RepID=M2ZDS6_9PSEU|nr:NAD--arginine ADP-ribosyltransferase [Amycolatopsis decaplanina]EME58529.1 NAD:arginine ADP-ribosyltransferase [Amycolatopsis decaplanina DSM 44594]